MSYHVEYSDTALKQLKKMDRFEARLITSWIGKNLEGCSDPPPSTAKRRILGVVATRVMP